MSEKFEMYGEEHDKPSIEQVAWVFKHLDDHLREGGSYRYLIYERMGFGLEAYVPLYEHGGMNLSNAFFDVRELEKEDTNYDETVETNNRRRVNVSFCSNS